MLGKTQINPPEGKHIRSESFRKRRRERRHALTSLRALLRRFSVEQWLRLIRTIEVERNRGSLQDLEFKEEFLPLVADAALRIAKIQNPAEPAMGPNSEDFKNVMSAYFAYDESPVILIQKLGIASISLLAHWQNRFNPPTLNTLGRMRRLYRDYESDIVEMIGLNLPDLQSILLFFFETYWTKKFVYFKTDAIRSHKIEGNLFGENIEKFLQFFAIDIKGYRAEAKRRKVYEKDIGKFNLLGRYPIVRIDASSYIIPSFEQLIESVAGNLYYHILAHKQAEGSRASKAFLDSFGSTLENYVVDLAKNTFEEKEVIPADAIVSRSSENRCEVVCTRGGKSLAIEVKKLHFQRDAVFDADIKGIESCFVRHLAKGYDQVFNTMKYLGEEKYGFIVIPDTMIPTSAILDHIIQNNTKEAISPDSRIQLCMLSEYEQLMSNSAEIVFEVLNMASSRSSAEGSSISMILGKLGKNNPSVKKIHPMLAEILREQHQI